MINFKIIKIIKKIKKIKIIKIIKIMKIILNNNLFASYLNLFKLIIVYSIFSID
jgi:hypothetical protein